ncbi:uncharacterized protein LOC125369822 [Ricinus communis]|uniref:uncharacterized protein LOC125369822 n=1 Tax=Ricinus communis TaxID=3988 RepID=UPI00201A26C7|nr:uncharacterized protein LOC125369822 [Ricinus communis]
MGGSEIGFLTFVRVIATSNFCLSFLAMKGNKINNTNNDNNNKIYFFLHFSFLLPLLSFLFPSFPFFPPPPLLSLPTAPFSPFRLRADQAAAATQLPPPFLPLLRRPLLPFSPAAASTEGEGVAVAVSASCRRPFGHPTSDSGSSPQKPPEQVSPANFLHRQPRRRFTGAALIRCLPASFRPKLSCFRTPCNLSFPVGTFIFEFRHRWQDRLPDPGVFWTCEILKFRFDNPSIPPPSPEAKEQTAECDGTVTVRVLRHLVF